MKTVARLDLQLEELEDDPLSDQIFYILDNTLQPDSELPLEEAVKQITALLPEGQPYSTDVHGFSCTCFEVAEQIPYDHPSMLRLVTVAYSCLNSEWLRPLDGSDYNYPYQKFGEAMYDHWTSSRPCADPERAPCEEPWRYVNFQAFVARLYEREMSKGANLAIWTLQEAFEGDPAPSEEEEYAYIKAASQWVLIYGDAIYAELMSDKKSLKKSLKKWKRWREYVDNVAEGKGNDFKRGWFKRWLYGDKKGWKYDEESVRLACRAALAMDALERVKAG